MSAMRLLLCVVGWVVLPLVAQAQVVGVAVDSKVALVNGAPGVRRPGTGDSAVFLEFSGAKWRRLGEVAVPTSYLGPPSSVAVSADGSLALVTASSRLEPAPADRFVPDNRLSVIDLKGPAPRVMQTLVLGAAPSSVRISPDGTMALVMHNPDDSVTTLALAGGKASIVEKRSLGKGSGPLAAAFHPDGRSVLITLADGQKVAMYPVHAGRLGAQPVREMTAGVTPFSPSYCGRSGLAVVNNFGTARGDADTVSLIDVRSVPPRVIDTATVGPAPEDVVCSRDGRYAAAAVQNLSNRPPSEPFHSPHSLLVLLKIEGRQLRRVAEVPVGGWAQGVGFLDDSRTLFIQSIVDRSMALFRIEGETLKEAGPPIVFPDGAPVSYGMAGR